MSEPIIRWAERSDAQAAHALIHELATYEKAPQEHTCTLEQFTEDGFGSRPSYKLLVAEEKAQVLGIALFFDYYSTWKGRCLYLDDLIVTEKERGRGIGKMLMDKLMAYAEEGGYHSVRWQVLDWNEPAINFYRSRYAASFDGEWLNCLVRAGKRV